MSNQSPGPVLVLGGARSGKSAFSEKLVEASGLIKHYVATGRAWDDEMRERIDHHRTRRGEGWTTHEEPVDLVGVLRRIDDAHHVVLIDCLTLWVTNLMLEERDIEAEFAALAASCLRRERALSLFPTRSASASCPRTAWRASFATMPAGFTRSLRRNPLKFTLSRPVCR